LVVFSVIVGPDSFDGRWLEMHAGIYTRATIASEASVAAHMLNCQPTVHVLRGPIMRARRNPVALDRQFGRSCR
jgi:hypothetical protein